MDKFLLYLGAYADMQYTCNSDYDFCWNAIDKTGIFSMVFLLYCQTL